MFIKWKQNSMRVESTIIPDSGKSTEYSPKKTCIFSGKFLGQALAAESAEGSQQEEDQEACFLHSLWERVAPCCCSVFHPESSTSGAS